MLGFLLTILSASAGPDCTTPTTGADIVAHANVARVALDNVQMPTFHVEVRTVVDAIPCLRQALTPEEAATAHEMAAYAAFQPDHTEQTTAYFSTVLSLSPEFNLPAIFEAAGHPMTAALQQARNQGPKQPATVVVPPDMTVIIDGSPGDITQSGRPFLLQLIREDDTIAWSGLVAGTSEVPDWIALGFVDDKAWDKHLGAIERERRRAHRSVSRSATSPGSRKRVRLVGATGAFALSGAFYGLAMHYRSQLNSIDSPDVTDHADTVRATNEVLEYQDRTNEMLIATTIFGAAGLTLGVSAFLTVQF